MKKAAFIVVAFTLKGQEFSKIREQLEKIAKENPDAELIHGFMPREVVEAKGWNTEVVDTLDELFPKQKSFYTADGVDRDAMKNYAYNNLATAYVIGRVKDGVKEEMILYVKAGVKVKTVELEEEEAEEEEQQQDTGSSEGGQGNDAGSEGGPGENGNDAGSQGGGGQAN